MSLLITPGEKGVGGRKLGQKGKWVKKGGWGGGETKARKGRDGERKRSG